MQIKKKIASVKLRVAIEAPSHCNALSLKVQWKRSAQLRAAKSGDETDKVT